MTPVQVMTLVLLAMTWLGVAVPLALRGREESVAGQVIGFHHALSVLDPATKATTVTAHTTTSTRATRTGAAHLQTLRRLLGVAVAATVMSVAGAVTWRGVFVPLAVMSVLGTVGYVGLLRRRKVEQDRARAVITSMRSHAGMAPRERAHDVQVMPRVVGGHWDDVTPARWDDDRRSHEAGAPRDVRVVSGERIRAHDGFDVLT